MTSPGTLRVRRSKSVRSEENDRNRTVTVVRAALLAHFDRHQRDLPWRRLRDPYAIWVSEVMLQQTRVETVIPYYTRFLARFPTARALADAPLEAVLTAWSGLGYYRRARMLHAGAQAVIDQYGGAVPADPDALRSLPGVGAYTAGAIASIAFGLREPLVDGNVERVITRLFAIPGDPRAGESKRLIWSLARGFADCDRPGDVNQALMDLGATICVPVAPKCLVCPLQKACVARHQGDPERYPEKRVRAAVRAEQWSALVALDSHASAAWLWPSEIGRWTRMLLPPLVRSDEALAFDAGAYFATLGANRIERAGHVVHTLTHASMAVTVYRGLLASDPERGRMVPLGDLDTEAIPKITRAILAAAVQQ